MTAGCSLIAKFYLKRFIGARNYIVAMLTAMLAVMLTIIYICYACIITKLLKVQVYEENITRGFFPCLPHTIFLSLFFVVPQYS